MTNQDTSGDPVDRLREAIEEQDSGAADETLDQLSASESARAVAYLSDDDQTRLLTMLPDDEAADLLETLPEDQAAFLVEHLDTEEAAEILNEVESDEQADILARLDEEKAEAILAEMRPEEAEDARRLMQYDPETAGGLMITEFLAYPSDWTVDDVVRDLRTNQQKYREYNIQYAYVTDPQGRLIGVLRLRDLLLEDSDKRLPEVMIPDPKCVDVSTPLEELERLFENTTLFGIPVTEVDGTLVGVIRKQDVEQAAKERSSRTMLKLTGIMGGEELRVMPLRIRSVRRLSWLSINVILNIVAASVIAMYQETLQQVIALAVFLPIISDMSGCSGNQAVAVSMRELSLGLIRPSEFFRVLYKEASVGIVNGLVLGLLLGFVAVLWQGNPALGFVVAAALAVNTVIAACIGGSVPLLLKGLKQDPALASGPILTTITDMCGFFLVLSLANAMLPWLT